ncbi:MAG: YndJ family transporter [Pirellulales bacterium]
MHAPLPAAISPNRRALALPELGRLLSLAAAIALVRPDLLTALLWFALLVLVPAAARLGPSIVGERPLRRLLTGWPALLAALGVIAASALPTGWPAGLLAAPWLVIAAVWAGLAALRLTRFPRQTIVENALDVAALLMLVGAAWVVLDRLAWRFSFDAEIVRLTGIHFHYAGFVLPTLAACAAKRRPGILTSAILVAALGGFGLVAIGITFSPAAEVVGAAAMVVACGALAVVQIQTGIATRRPEIFAPLALSSAALVAAMALAAVYARGEYSGQKWIDIPTMIATHGLANAVGFAGAGLLGWTRLVGS